MTSMMSHLRSAATLAAASVLLAGFTTPAVAKDAAVNEQAKTVTTGAGASVESAAEKKYCIKDTITGSRQTKKICKTKEQWSAAGVEIPAEK